MTATRKNRFVTAYMQSNCDEMIVVLKDLKTGMQYLEVVTDKGIALAPMAKETDEAEDA